MSEARALTNLVGNGVATLVVSSWEKELDKDRMKRILNNETDIEAEEPELIVEGIQAADIEVAVDQA